MSKFYFTVNLKPHHDAAGVSIAEVRHATNVHHNTVKRYAEHNYVEQRRIDDVIALLCDYYGVSFHDVVDVHKK